MPGTGDHAVFDATLFEPRAAVRAHRAHRHCAVAPPHNDDRRVRVHLHARGPVGEARRVAARRPLRNRAVERGAIHADPELADEMTAEVAADGREGRAAHGQTDAGGAVPAPARGPRAGVQRERRRVDERVDRPDPAR